MHISNPRRHRRAVLVIDGASDLGPAIRHRPVIGPIASGPAGAVVRELRPADLQREDRPDPDAPKRTVRGARRRDGLRDMYEADRTRPEERRRITDAHWHAAEAFRSDLAVASGARPPRAAVRVQGAGEAGYGPTERQVDATTRARGAHQAVGLIHAGVLSWVVISGGSLRDYETCKGIRHGRGTDMLVAALDRLADYYSR